MVGRSARLHASTLVLGALGIAAIAFLPFLNLRPNRIAEGEPFLLFHLDPWWAIALIGLWALELSVCFAGVPETIRVRTSLLVSVLAPAGALLAAGALCRRLAGADPVSRASLSSGFWTTILISYVSFLANARHRGTLPAFLRRAVSASVPALLAALLLSGALNSVSILREWSVQKPVFLAELSRHAALAGSSVLAASALGLVAGVLALRSTGLRRVVFFVLSIVQTIPSLALFGFMILPLAWLADRFPALRAAGISGIGTAPALIALAIYGMLPVARNTYTALKEIPVALADAGRGMGMTRAQLLLRVEAPLAVPIIMAGIRTTAVQAVGNTVVTALIGAGGLGVFIFQGLGQFAPDMILLGTLPIIAMAILTDTAMGALVLLLTPRALRGARL